MMSFLMAEFAATAPGDTVQLCQNLNLSASIPSGMTLVSCLVDRQFHLWPNPNVRAPFCRFVSSMDSLLRWALVEKTSVSLHCEWHLGATFSLLDHLGFIFDFGVNISCERNLRTVDHFRGYPATNKLSGLGSSPFDSSGGFGAADMFLWAPGCFQAWPMLNRTSVCVCGGLYDIYFEKNVEKGHQDFHKEINEDLKWMLRMIWFTLSKIW